MHRLVITRTPLRVSFVGGGSDLPGVSSWCNGATVSSTIDKHVYVVAKWRSDDKVILHWREREEVGHAKDLKHELVRESLLMMGVTNGIEIVTFADVPGVGSGLGSSAATTVGLLNAIYHLKGYGEVEMFTLAEEASKVEIQRLGRSCGRQDQYAVTFGGVIHISYDRGRVLEVNVSRLEQFDRKRLSDNFLLFSPRLVSGRDSETILSEFSDSEVFRKSCCELAAECRGLIQRCEYDSIGNIVLKHHLLKSQHFPYMNAETIDRLVELGNFKLCGAGNTGHLLVDSCPENHSGCKSLGEKLWGPELPFEFVDYGSKVIHAE
jgi:D-glycero-alpha-D-manno-heptose-7-phosphate kinase